MVVIHLGLVSVPLDLMGVPVALVEVGVAQGLSVLTVVSEQPEAVYRVTDQIGVAMTFRIFDAVAERVVEGGTGRFGVTVTAVLYLASTGITSGASRALKK